MVQWELNMLHENIACIHLIFRIMVILMTMIKQRIIKKDIAYKLIIQQLCFGKKNSLRERKNCYMVSTFRVKNTGALHWFQKQTSEFPKSINIIFLKSYEIHDLSESSFKPSSNIDDECC